MRLQVSGTIVVLLLTCSSANAANSAIAPPPAPATTKVQPPPIPRLACPTELEPLSRALLRDLPSYINRFSSRNRVRTGEYAIVVSQPEFEPLPTGSSEYPQDQSLKASFFHCAGASIRPETSQPVSAVSLAVSSQNS